jgi:hypothetical protein
VLWLRESERKTGNNIVLERINGAGADDGGVAHGQQLLALAEAMLDEDEGRLASARARLIAAAGPAAFVDAAAVAALFNAIDRVADATGTPLEPSKREDSAGLRGRLGIDSFYSVEGKL